MENADSQTIKLSVTTLPVEIQIHILSHLPFFDHISAAQTCTTWRSILSDRRFRRTRYRKLEKETHGFSSPQTDLNLSQHKIHKNSRQDSTTTTVEPLEAHRLFYDQFLIPCFYCNQLPDSYISQVGNAKLVLDCSNPEYGCAILCANICPSTLEIIDYKIRVYRFIGDPDKRPSAFDGLSGSVTVPIPSTHPFLDDPVFGSSGVKVDQQPETEGIVEIGQTGFLRLPEVGWQVTLDNYMSWANKIYLSISPTTTIRELVQLTWDKLRTAYLSDPHPDVDTIKEVQFSFKPENLQPRMPVLQLDVVASAGHWIGEKFILRGEVTEPRIEEIGDDMGIYEKVLPVASSRRPPLKTTCYHRNKGRYLCT